jgi:acetylornithine/N-succinyldiaminopimelate aminotransferase
MGLMTGVDFDIEIKSILEKCQQNGLLLCKSGDNTLRFLPPLIVEKSHIDEAVRILTNAIETETAHANKNG